MSALPTPEVPPPESSDKHGASPRVATVHEPCRKPAVPPSSATARLYRVDPATTPTVTSRTRRERLVESVLRPDRGASTTRTERLADDHESSAAGWSLTGTTESGSGLRPRHNLPPLRVANPTDQQLQR